jgi:uncharacterized membrane protein
MRARDPVPKRLVDAYLHDLAGALAHVEAEVRQDVVASVSEHIDTALAERPGNPTADDVEDVLRELGPVEDIANDADDAPGSSCDETRNPDHANRDQPPAAASYLLAALIVAMAVSASVLTTRIPPFFSPEGGDPVAAAQLAWSFIVFAVAAFVIKRKTLK